MAQVSDEVVDNLKELCDSLEDLSPAVRAWYISLHMEYIGVTYESVTVDVRILRRYGAYSGAPWEMQRRGGRALRFLRRLARDHRPHPANSPTLPIFCIHM